MIDKSREAEHHQFSPGFFLQKTLSHTTKALSSASARHLTPTADRRRLQM